MAHMTSFAMPSSGLIRLGMAALAVVVLHLPMQANAQWIWLDGAGRKVFSDQAPPTNVPDSRILKRQGQPARTDLPTGAPAETKEEPRPEPIRSDGNELERKAQAIKTQNEAQLKAQAVAQKAKDDEIIAEDCQRAQRSQASLQSGVRLRTTNAQGEYEVMTEAARDAELQRIASYMQAYCNK
jgi:hypothetical protein